MDASRACFHCGDSLPAGETILARVGESRAAVCCHGCRAVAEFIHSSGLESFYAHRDAPDPDLSLRVETADYARFDLAAVERRYVHAADGIAEAVVDIGGMYCSACVWLLDRALATEPAIDRVSVNPSTRRAVIRWRRDALAFSELLERIARLGFRPKPRAAGVADDGRSEEQRAALRRLIVAAAAGMQVMMFAVALYAGAHYGIEGRIEDFLRLVSLLVCVPIVAYAARPFFAAAIRGLKRGMPGMDLPVSIAIAAAFLASAWATLSATGEVYFDSVAMFVLFLSAARYIEMRTRHRAEDMAEALATVLPETVTRLTRGDAEIVAVADLEAGDRILLRAGDIVPADGVVTSGELDIDESLLTGESAPVLRAVGAAVSAGSVNRAGQAVVRVTGTGAGTRLAETTRLLERARADRPVVAELADRVASRFVLAVLGITAVTGIVWLKTDPTRAFEAVLATLVVTCPCALALATPAALAASASRLAADGFLMVRARILEVLAGRPVIVFDKTGTLTAGRPSIDRIDVYASDLDEAGCLALAARIESASEHVLARAFACHAAAAGRSAEDLDTRVQPGRGVEAVVDGRTWRIGRRDWVSALSAAVQTEDKDSVTRVYLGNEDGIVAGFSLVDELRADAADAVDALQALGFELVIASGDSGPAVDRAADRLGIRQRHSRQSPADKLALIRSLQREGHRVVMVGDGINDAPVLAGADASIAIDAGTALARASADAVVPGRRLGTVAIAAGVARRTRRIIRQNIIWAIAYNLCAIPLAVTGLLAPWMAAIGMSASSLVVVGNATRLQTRGRKGPRNAKAAATAQEATS